MKIPVNLSHKPVIVSENYENIDGRYAFNSDAKGISLGIAQWTDEKKTDISAKVWRHTGNRWSRQSEELPIHRVLDLAIMICRTELYLKQCKYNEDEISKDIDKINVQNNSIKISLCYDNSTINEDIRLFAKIFDEEGKFIKERFEILSDILKKMGY